MDQTVRDYLLMTAIATIVSSAVLLITMFVFDDGQIREYCPYISVIAGMAAGLVFLYAQRKRNIFFMGERVLCERLRDISSILSFFITVPVVASLLLDIFYNGFVADDIILIAAIFVVVSMLIQAVFWKMAEDIGYLTFMNIIMLVLALIIMNISSLLCMDHGGYVLLLIGVLMAIAPVLLMHDWQWTVDITLIILLVSAVIGTIAVVLADFSSNIGHILSFWIPLLFIFLIGFRLKGAFLMSDGKKLF